jgi:hypothetical protein
MEWNWSEMGFCRDGHAQAEGLRSQVMGSGPLGHLSNPLGHGPRRHAEDLIRAIEAGPNQPAPTVICLGAHRLVARRGGGGGGGRREEGRVVLRE